MTSVSLIGIIFMVIWTTVYAALLPLLMTPVLFFPSPFTYDIGWKFLMVVASCLMFMSCMFACRARLKISLHPMSTVEVVAVSIYSLATPFIFHTVLSHLAWVILGTDLSTDSSMRIIIYGTGGTAFGSACTLGICWRNL